VLEHPHEVEGAVLVEVGERHLHGHGQDVVVVGAVDRREAAGAVAAEHRVLRDRDGPRVRRRVPPDRHQVAVPVPVDVAGGHVHPGHPVHPDRTLPQVTPGQHQGEPPTTPTPVTIALIVPLDPCD
jgi:hypothetical protein